MHVRALTALLGALLITVASPMLLAARHVTIVPEPTNTTAIPQAYVSLERVIEAADLGLRIPAGITFARESGALLVTGTRTDGSAALQTLSLLEQLQSSTALPAGVPPTADVAYDSTLDRLVVATDADSLIAVPAADGRVQAGAAGAESTVEGQAGNAAPTGVEVNPAGETLVLDPSGTVSVSRSLSPTTAGVDREVSLSGAGEALSGLAVAADGHLFSVGTASATLYEFDAAGTLLARRDLASLGVESPQDIAIAPSADTSDAAAKQNVYVADAGAADGTSAGVVELALVEPVLSPLVALAAVTSVSLVNTFNTGSGSTWSPDSPDPSGLTYIAASETEVPTARRDRLVSADGEVDETTGAGFNNVNVWFAPRNGATDTAVMNTNASPTNPVNNEPVGVAYDPVRNELYICKDGANGRIWVYNVVGTNITQARSFTVTGAPYNNGDAEGLAFGNGNLYMVDAFDNDLVKVQPGGNGIVGTGGDDIVNNYDLQQYGQTEPEGLDVDPATGNIWVVSNSTNQPMIEVTPTGALVSSVSIGAANPNSPAGLAIGPASGPSGTSIYIADRGVDNNDVPTENDGKIYEFSLGPTGPPAPDTTITSGPQGTVTSTDASFEFTGTAGTTSFECQLDAAAFSACTSPQSYTGLAFGTHTFNVRALNGTTADPTPATRTWTIQDPNAPPNILLNPSFELDANGDNRPDSWTSNAKFTRSNAVPAQDGSFVGRHLNNNAVIFQEVSTTAGTAYDFSGKVNLVTTADAFSFQLNVQWRGNNANVGSPVVIHNFTDDTGSLWVTRTATLTAPAGATSARVQMDGNSMNATGTAYVDAFSFGVSGPPPLNTTIDSGPSGSVTATDATFTFSGTATAVSFQCKLDLASFTACTSPQNYAGPLALGDHTFEVRALDAGSNPDPTPATRTWTIVPPPPLDTTITGGPSGTTTATNATFTFTGTGAASFQCKLDLASFTACTSPQNYPGPLALGDHTFEVRALDAGSNPDPTPATRTWTIVAGSTNLLTNPGFELDADANIIPDSWGTNTKFTRSTAITPHGGSFVGRHVSTTDNDYSVFQEVAATVGTQYTFTGWVNIPAPADPTFAFNLRLRWMNGATTLSTSNIPAFTTATSGWQPFTLTATAPTSTTSVRALMGVGTLNGTIYVDDFSLVTGP